MQLLPSLAFPRRLHQRVHHPAPADDQHYDSDGREQVDSHAMSVIVIALDCGLVLLEPFDRGLARCAVTPRAQFTP
jgi:hypothetical protein